jgi:hypothetical protein
MSDAHWVSFNTGVWVVFLAALYAHLHRWVGAARLREAAGLVGLVAGGLVIRWVLATWGPGDLQVDQAQVLDGVPGLSRYGPSSDGFFTLLFLVAPSRFGALHAVSLAFGALAPAFVVAAGRRLGLSAGAWAAGLALALHPLAIRHAGEASRMGMLLFLCAVAFWSVARRGPLRSGWLDALTGAAALTLVVQLRAEPALVLAALWPLALLRRSAPGLAACALATALAVPFTLTWGANATVGDYVIVRGPHLLTWLDPYFSGWGWVVLALGGLALALRRAPGLALGALALSAACLVLFSSVPSNPPEYANARYQTVTFVPGALLVGFAAQWLGERGRAWLLAGLLALAGGAAWAIPSVTSHKTIDWELAFVRLAVDVLPPDAVVVFVDPGELEVGLDPPAYLSMIEGRRGEWRDLGPEAALPVAADDARPLFYYHSAACESALDPLLPDPSELERVRARCAEALARYGAVPVVSGTLPARPFAIERWQVDPIPVAFYRVDRQY